MAQRIGTGMFPREVMKRFPLLPVEEEGRLNDMPLRENFIERVFAYYRWTRMLNSSTKVFRNEIRSMGHSRRGIHASPEAHSDELVWFHLDEEPTPGGLVPVPAVRAGKFHTAHKLTLMAHGH